MATTALVTGGNRGIGLEVCRQLGGRGLRVVVAARAPADGERAAEALRAEGLDARIEEMDVAREASVLACARRLERAGERVGVLVNNAGVYPEGGVLEASSVELRGAMDVHFFGALWTCRAFVPAMMRAGYGRVVNVSSGYGSIAEGLEGPAAYSLSKAALNALTVKLASEVGPDVKVNAACPGWVRTRMGGAAAPRTPAEGAETIVWLATLPPEGPSGGFFRDRRAIPW